MTTLSIQKLSETVGAEVAGLRAEQMLADSVPPRITWWG